MEYTAILGNLRGREAPNETVLRRLHDMNPNYRVTWTPPTPDRTVNGRVFEGRPGLWWVHEIRPGNPHDEARRAAAFARLRRYERAGSTFRARNLGVPEQCEEMIAGFHSVGSWPENGMVHRDQQNRIASTSPAFGSEAFFQDLQQGEAMFRIEEQKVQRERVLNKSSDEFVEEELDENPEFQAHIRDNLRQAATEDWALIFAGKVGVLVNKPTPQGDEPDAGTNREQVARPADGEDRQPEERTDGLVPGQRQVEHEVWAGFDGPREAGGGSGAGSH